MNIFTLFGEIALNGAEAVGEIKEVEQQAERTSERMEGFFGRVYDSVERLSGGLDRLGKRTTDIGKWVSTRLTVPITALGTVALNTAANFESAMNRVRALTGATGEELAALEEQAMELGRTTQFSASQAADAMGFLAMAGFDTNQILGAMPSVLQLAASAQLDMARAADITTNILTGYGMEVEELQRANDVLVKSFISANTDLVQLGEAFKYAGPVAKAAGLDFEETAALLSMMGNAGIQASMAGTSLRGAITRLLNPTKQIQDILAKYNVRVRESDGRLRSMTRILADLSAAGVDAGDVMALFGDRAGPAMQALLDQGTDAIDAFVAMLQEAAGTAEQISDVQMEGLSGAIITLKSAWEGLMLAVSRSGPLNWATNLINTLAGAVQRLAALNPEVLRFLSIMAGLAAALGPALIALGQLTRLLGSSLSAIAGIRTAMLALFTGPAAPFVIAAGVLLGFGYRFLSSMEDVEEGTKSTLDRVMDFIEVWGPRAVAGFRAVSLVVGNVFDGMRQRIGRVLESIGKLWFTAVDAIGDAASWLLDHLATALAFWAVVVFRMWDAIAGVFDSISQAWQDLAVWLSELWDSVKIGEWEEAWSNIVETAQRAWDGLTGWDGWEKLWNAIKSGWESLSEFVSDIWETISTTVKDAWNALTSWDGWEKLWSGVEEGWQALTSSIGMLWSTAMSNVTLIWSDVTQWDGWDKLWNLIEAGWENLKAAIESVWNAVSTFVKDVWNALVSWEGWRSLWETVLDTWTKIEQTVVDVWNRAVESVKNTLDDLKQTFDNVVESIRKTWESLVEWEGWQRLQFWRRDREPVPPSVPEPVQDFVPARRTLAGTLDELERVSRLEGLASLLASIWRAEGGKDAAVPFGMTGFVEQGHRFASQINRQTFRRLLEETGAEEGSLEYFAAAAATSALHYWRTFQRSFPEAAGQTLADLSPELRDLFIKHMWQGFSPPEENPDWGPNVKLFFGELLELAREYGFETVEQLAEGVEAGLAQVTPGMRTTLAQLMREGGTETMRAWAEGALEATGDVEDAVQQIAQIPADYLIGQSPPPKGPLSQIGEGAEAVAETWIERFLARVQEMDPEIAQRLQGIVSTIGGWIQPLRDKGRELGEAFASEYNKALKEAEQDHVESLERQLEAERKRYEESIKAQQGFVDRSRSFAERFAQMWEQATQRMGQSFERMIANVGTMWLTGEGEWRQILSSFLSSAISQILSAAFAAMGIAQLVSKAMANMWNPVGWIVIAGLVAALSALQRSLASQLKGVSGGSYPSTDAGGSIPLPDDASPTTPTPPSAGRQIAEITGASRDLLVDLLSPLARLDEQTGILQRIHSVLDERLPRFDTGLALAGVGASGPSVVIERIEVNTAATDAAGITDDLVWELERRLGGFMSFKARGGG